jgi:hypothetical protein
MCFILLIERYIRENSMGFQSTLRALRKGTSEIYEGVGRVADENTYGIRYLLAACESRRIKVVEEEVVAVEGGEDNMEIDLGF